MKNKSCTICNNKKYVQAFPFNTYFNGKFFTYKKCVNCKFVRIFPYPNKQDIVKLYNNKSYHEKFYLDVNNEQYKDSIKFLKKFINKRVKILDFGSGNGDFIKQIEHVHDCYGVEYDLETIKKLRKKLKKSKFLDISEIKKQKYNNFFDVIHLGDVLEHVISPDKLLINLHKKIKKDGFLYIEGPIERNISLVNILIILYGNVKKFLISDYKNNFKPYHLYFCDFKKSIIDD